MILERLFPTEKRVLSNDKVHRQSIPHFDGLVWVLIWKYDKYMNYGRAICSRLSYVSLIRHYMYSCFKCSSISRRIFHNTIIQHPKWHLIRPTFQNSHFILPSSQTTLNPSQFSSFPPEKSSWDGMIAGSLLVCCLCREDK